MRIADWPMALVLRDLEQRAALRALDRCQFGGCVGRNAGRLRADQAQQPAMRRDPRVPGAWRARTRRGTRGPRWRQAEAVDFADDGVAGNADLGGDLTAGQAGADAVPELLDALRSPSLDTHVSMLIERPSRLRRPFWAPKRAKAPPKGTRETAKSPNPPNSCPALPLRPRTTEPHPHQ